MSIFGNVRQLGFISRDIDRSVRLFVDSWGIGPWFVLRNVRSLMLYRGQPVELDLSIALANCHDLQFEIVTQHNDSPSLYMEALTHTPDLHVQHLAYWAADVPSPLAKAELRGWSSIFETTSGQEKSMFLRHPDAPKICVEISDCSPRKDRTREKIRTASWNWDGRDPIRQGMPD